jgi:hypothetical protein
MGGAIVACLRGHCVVEVDRTAIHVVTRTSARQRIFRREPDEGMTLAWELSGRPEQRRPAQATVRPTRVPYTYTAWRSSRIDRSCR